MISRYFVSKLETLLRTYCNLQNFEFCYTGFQSICSRKPLKRCLGEISQISINPSKKTNGRLDMTSNFVFRGQKTNGYLNVNLDFLICCQKVNDRFGATLELSCFVVTEWRAAWVQFSISYFAVKNEWPFGYSFQNFAFRCEKTNGRLGTTKKSVFRCKKVNGRWGKHFTTF